MNVGRRVLLTVLVYVTLDLSLASMPGAFVFDPDDSVESVQMNRGRAATEVVPLPAISRDWLMMAPPVDVIENFEAARDLGGPAHPVVSRLPRATLPPTPPAEDPH